MTVENNDIAPNSFNGVLVRDYLEVRQPFKIVDMPLLAKLYQTWAIKRKGYFQKTFTSTPK